MTVARDWRRYWQQVPSAPDAGLEAALGQVGKTLLGTPVDPAQLNLIVAAIRTSLRLGGDERVVDLGCGNGLLTERIAGLVARVEGVDISPRLIADARRYRQAPNVTYRVGDLTEAHRLGPPSGDRLYAYEVLQHLRAAEVTGLLSWMRQAATDRGVVFFAGSIPDAARIRRFYDTPERWERYLRMQAEGREQIGTWWSFAELAELVREAGFEVRRLQQDPRLYTAHYRFDALLFPR